MLPAGTQTLMVTAGAETLATSLEVTNDGLVRIGGVSQVAPDQPFVISIDSVAPLSALEVEATAGGQPLPVDVGSGEVRLDPWAFEPGALDVAITVKAGSALAAAETVSVEVPPLQPQLLVEPVEGGEAPAVDVSWRAQGASLPTLIVTIDGAVALETQQASATVPVPDGSTVEASLVTAAGATLASQTTVVEVPGGGGAAGGLRLWRVAVRRLAAIARGARDRDCGGRCHFPARSPPAAAARLRRANHLGQPAQQGRAAARRQLVDPRAATRPRGPLLPRG